MDYTNKEKAILNRDRKKFRKAEILFKSFMKKYDRNKKLKQLHFTKNKNSRYIGETIFIDMIISYPYTKEEKELLYICLINMPPKVLSDFEQLYIKSSSRKFINYIEAITKHIEHLYENKSLNEGAYKLYNEKILSEDKSSYLKDKLTNIDRKYGKYTQLFKEIDYLIEQDKINSTFKSKKDIILFVLDKYLEAGDNEYLMNAYEKCGNNYSKISYNFERAYYNYVRNKP